MTGIWIFENIVKETAYTPYQDIRVTYLALISQEGNQIKGSAEKIRDITSTGIREYVGKDRSKVIIQGHVSKRYFAKDQIVIHYEEEALLRKSTTIFAKSLQNLTQLCILHDRGNIQFHKITPHQREFR